MSFSMVALHKRQDLLDACVLLLNSEWPRSQAARLHSLEKSCEGLPYSLIMIEAIDAQEKVAGYCRLAKVVNQPKAVFIESVVVPTDRRGQGLGRHLMDLAEEHSRQDGYTQIYLTTKDKQGFYEHLGYQYCKPVNTLNAQVLETCACQLLTNTIVSQNCSTTTNSTCSTSCVKQEEAKPDDCNKAETSCSSQSNSTMPSAPDTLDSNQDSTCCKSESSLESNNTNCQDNSCQQNQACIQAPCLSAPPPPPPPPPPPMVEPTITVYWMMKDLFDKQ